MCPRDISHMQDFNKIENHKIKLVPSLYGFGGSYTHIFFIILGILNKIQKI